MLNRPVIASALPLVTLMVMGGLAPPRLAQTQFQERAVKGYFAIIPDTTEDLVAADFDGDDDLDVLKVNGWLGARLYLNDGRGLLVDVTETHMPSVPLAVAYHTRVGIGDIDGDGDIDVLFAAGHPTLLVNDGTGRFSDETAARVSVMALQGVSRLLFGDIDGDSDLDLVTANQGGPAGLFLNDGLGFFTDVSASQMPTIVNATGAAVLADVDSDLDLDLVLANGSQDRLYLNDGLGFFTDVTLTHLPVETGGTSPKAMVLVDVDLDLDLDMVVADDGPNVLWLNDGTGVFIDASSNLPSLAMTPDSLVAGDVNGDLNPDLVFGNQTQSRLFLGNGSGGFVDSPFPQRGLERDHARGLALADIDSDGDLDLLMGRAGVDRMYMNDGTGGFANTAGERMAWSLTFRPAAIELIDLDLDGDQDLILGGGEFGGLPEVGPLGAAYFNDGTGVFPTMSTFMLNNPVALATGDVDGDTYPDVLVGTASTCFFGCSPNDNKLLLNDGSGGLTSGTLPFDQDDTLAVELADVDGDGDLDALFGNWQQQNRLYLNDGLGTFTDVTAISLPVRFDSTHALALGDFDGDGDLDIVAGNADEQSRMYVNDGFGTFVDLTDFRMPSLVRKTRALGVGDLNDDGHLDLVLGNDGQPGLYLNDGFGKLLDFTDYMPQQTEETWALQLSDVDEDGDLDVVLGNRSPFNDEEAENRLLLNDGTARFSDSGRLPADLDRTAALGIGDIDGDLDPDILTGNFIPRRLNTVRQNRIYLNLHRQLSAPLLPILGRTYRIKFDSEPGYGTAPRTGIVAFSNNLLPVPISIASIQGVLVLLPPFFFSASAAIPSPSGSQVIDVPVPNTQALLGLDFYAQGLILGGGSPAGFTGYLRETLGL